MKAAYMRLQLEGEKRTITCKRAEDGNAGGALHIAVCDCVALDDRTRQP